MRRTLVVVALALSACRTPEPPPRGPYDDLPRRSLAAARAALPEPSAAGAFVFDGRYMEWMNWPDGHVRVAVESGEYDGLPAWLVMHESDEGKGRMVRRTAWLSRELFVLRSVLTDGTFHETAVAERHGVVVTTTRDGETQTTAMTQPLDGIATLGGALLFLRLCPRETAAYGEPPFCPCVTRVDDESMDGVAPTKSGMAWVSLSGAARDPVLVRRGDLDDTRMIVAERRSSN